MLTEKQTTVVRVIDLDDQEQFEAEIGGRIKLTGWVRVIRVMEGSFKLEGSLKADSQENLPFGTYSSVGEVPNMPAAVKTELERCILAFVREGGDSSSLIETATTS